MRALVYHGPNDIGDVGKAAHLPPVVVNHEWCAG